MKLATFLSRELSEVFVKCYAHPEKEAVGVCRECGKGICEACAVEVGDKLYCKACIREEVVKKGIEERRIAKPERATVITVASVLFYVFGALGIVGSILLMEVGERLSSMLARLPPESRALLEMTGFSPSLLFYLGLASAVLSALYIVAGRYLWLSLKRGGVLGIAVCVVSMALSIPLTPLGVASTLIGIIIDVALIALIAVGWNTLK